MLSDVLSAILALFILILLSAAVGITWAGALIRKDQLFAWAVPYIKKIPIKFFRSLLTCHKCVAGQFALWLYIVILISYKVPFHVLMIFGCAMWTLTVILVADLLYKWIDFDKTPPADSAPELEIKSVTYDTEKKEVVAEWGAPRTDFTIRNRVNPESKKALETRMKKDEYLVKEGMINSPLKYFGYNSTCILKGTLKLAPTGTKEELKDSQSETRIENLYGTIEIGFCGNTFKLKAYQHGTELFVPFKDSAEGVSTKGRYLNLPIPTDGVNEVTLDFNYAYNPYCEYSNKYACVLVPAENTLPFAIPAGEKAYY